MPGIALKRKSLWRFLEAAGGIALLIAAYLLTTPLRDFSHEASLMGNVGAGIGVFLFFKGILEIIHALSLEEYLRR